MGRQPMGSTQHKELDLLILERSLTDLTQTATAAFPDTEKRQNALGSVRVDHVTYDRPDSDKLLVTAKMTGETNQYTTQILFDNVEFTSADSDQNVVDIGATEHIVPIASSVNDCKVLCECLDFYYTFAWYDYNKDSLIGKPPKPYQKVPGSNRPPRNPTSAPGICKHVMKLAEHLKAQGVITG